MGAKTSAKWGIDFVVPIKPATRSSHVEYTIAATDYLTKWAEAKEYVSEKTRGINGSRESMPHFGFGDDSLSPIASRLLLLLE